jgi:hypothetical protein
VRWLDDGFGALVTHKRLLFAFYNNKKILERFNKIEYYQISDFMKHPLADLHLFDDGSCFFKGAPQCRSLRYVDTVKKARQSPR